MYILFSLIANVRLNISKYVSHKSNYKKINLMVKVLILFYFGNTKSHIIYKLNNYITIKRIIN